MIAGALLARAVVAPASASASRPTVTLSGESVLFFPGHLLLDAHGHAFLDDGVLHVSADHITLDIRARRYVAIGSVSVRASDVVLRSAGAAPTSTPATGPTATASPSANAEPSPTAPSSDPPASADSAAAARATVPTSASATGDVFAEDIATSHGLLVALDAMPTERAIEGGAVGSVGEVAPEVAGAEPLALPDFGNELAFASARSAVVHVGADVRLTAAKVLVPGSKTLALPSYVYLYASDPGYTVSNLGATEDVPLYFGSTRNSVQGIHFIYRPDVKFSLGLDERIVSGPKGYVLISGAPLTGRSKALNFSWVDQINGHTQQTLTSTSLQDIGTTDQYDVRDGIHRSFLEFTATQFQSNVNASLGWQSYDEALARAGMLSGLNFHLRSEYGFLHTPLQLGFSPLPTNTYLPQYIFHVSGEAYVATKPLALGPGTTTFAAADTRYVHDTLPHNLSTQTFSLTLTQRANRYITLGASISDTPVEDGYPSVGAVYASRFDTETTTFAYNRNPYFSLLLTGTHATGSTQLPAGIIVGPWSTSADVRLRILPTLSVELGRSYYFGFEGQRFGTWTFQLFP